LPTLLLALRVTPQKKNRPSAAGRRPGTRTAVLLFLACRPHDAPAKLLLAE